MTVAIYGHRGYPARFPENSLQGFEYACEHGIDGIETDVQMSADGHLVIMHDERVDRTTDGTGWIADLTLPALAQHCLQLLAQRLDHALRQRYLLVAAGGK